MAAQRPPPARGREERQSEEDAGSWPFLVGGLYYPSNHWVDKTFAVDWLRTLRGGIHGSHLSRRLARPRFRRLRKRPAGPEDRERERRRQPAQRRRQRAREAARRQVRQQ